MDTPANLPLALYKAHLALGLHMLGQLKTARQRWYELGAQLVADDVARTEAAQADLQRAQDWQAAAAMLPDTFWQAQQRGMHVMQCVMQTALANQANFAAESQRAMLAWQQAVVQALNTTGNAMPMQTTLQGMLSAFGAPADVFIKPAPLTATATAAPARNRGNGQLRAAS